MLATIHIAEIICSLPVIIPYLIVGFIVGSFAGDDGTLESWGVFGQFVCLLIMVAWPLFFLIIWLFGEDGVLVCKKRKK